MTTARPNVEHDASGAYRQVAADYIRVGSQHLHEISSRTDPATLAAEVERLNTAVRASVGEGVSPFTQPADYQVALLQFADAGTGHASTAGADRAPQRAAPAGKWPTLAEAARKLTSGEVTSEQLTRQALERAAATQAATNAFIEIWADRALAQARTADAERARGKVRGPLHGIPLAHKDCFEIEGHGATIGSKARAPVQAMKDAHVVHRLNEAGAVTLGTLNLNEMVAGPTGQNPAFGDCCNALDPSRISGGSSSGSGAAVANGTVFASLGSDTGGSVRLPASVHGLFGMKPTYGRVSRSGCFPRAFTLDCVGPLARTAEDCAILLQAVSGHDRQDPSALAAPVPDYQTLLETGAEGSRVAVIGLDETEACDPGIAAVFNEFLVRVEQQFGAVPEVAFPQLSACYALGDIISKVEAATLHGQWMRSNGHAYSQAVYSRTEPGLHVPAVRYLEALMARAQVLRDFLAGPMAHADVLICPTIPIPVPLRTEADMEQKGSVFNVVAAITRLTRPFSYLGVPVLTMPIGRDVNGMPVGAQLIGRPLAEARLLALAHQMSVGA